MSLDQLKSILSAVHIQGLNGKEPDRTLLNTHFQHTDLKEVGKFYDRDECTQDITNATASQLQVSSRQNHTPSQAV
jgi:hypothetical protein